MWREISKKNRHDGGSANQFNNTRNDDKWLIKQFTNDWLIARLIGKSIDWLIVCLINCQWSFWCINSIILNNDWSHVNDQRHQWSNFGSILIVRKRETEQRWRHSQQRTPVYATEGQNDVIFAKMTSCNKSPGCCLRDSPLFTMALIDLQTCTWLFLRHSLSNLVINQTIIWPVNSWQCVQHCYEWWTV